MYSYLRNCTRATLRSVNRGVPNQGYLAQLVLVEMSDRFRALYACKVGLMSETRTKNHAIIEVGPSPIPTRLETKPRPRKTITGPWLSIF